MGINIPERIRLDVHLHSEDGMQGGLSAKLDTLTELVKEILKKENVMSKELDALEVQVKQNTDAENSAVLLLQGLSTQIAAIKTDPVKLQTLADELKSSADALAQAVVANTPAEEQAA